MLFVLFNLKTIKFTSGVGGIINIYVSALILMESQRDEESERERKRERERERELTNLVMFDC